MPTALPRARRNVIGHSMGGVISRYWGRAANAAWYQSPHNWYGGDIHRLIILDSPQWGSRLANELRDQMPSDLQQILANHGLQASSDAVTDLCVGSQALQDMGPSLVAGHALVGSVDVSINGLFDDSLIIAMATSAKADILAAVSGKMDLLQALVVMARYGYYHTDYLFGGPYHDFIVGCDSQKAGLPAGAVSPVFRSSPDFWTYWHGAVTSSPAYAAECESLLTNGGVFVPFIPPPVSAAYIGPAAGTLYEPAQPTGTVLPASLIITSPAEGTPVGPGLQLLMTVQPSGSAALTSSVLLGPGSCAQSGADDPSHITFTVPLEAAGDYSLFAVGQLADGRFADSAPLHLTIDLTGCEPTTLRFWQEGLSLEPYENSAAPCLIDCTDGITRSLAGETAGLTFSSTDEAVATVDSHGSVTAVAPGWCTVTAQYQALLATLDVEVREPTPDFWDVPSRFWAFYQIRAALRSGIVAGYPDGGYHPEYSVTRDQMAVYISRALAGGDARVPSGPATATFSDVPTDYWAFKYVEYAVAENVVKGYSDGTYKPTDQVDRGQMSVFIARAIATPTAGADLVNYTPPVTPTFPDVATTFWAYKYVEYIAQPSIAVTKGYPDGDYHPEYVCTRDQMAVYVARAFKLLL